MGKRKILFWLSVTAEAVLVARPKPASVAFSIVALLMLSILQSGKNPTEPTDFSEKTARKQQHSILIPAAILQLLIVIYAFINWGEAFSGQFAGHSILQRFRETPLVFLAILVVAAIGFYAVKTFFSLFANRKENEKTVSTDLRKTPLSTKARWVFCFLCALIPITICSENSFFYPMNHWVDVNCFMTVGKSWMHGMVPYRDLLEQKGPFLYLLYGIASLISESTYLGAWALEILSGTIFLYFADRTAVLYMGEDRKKEFVLVPFLAILTFTSNAFGDGGSTEEFCLPVLMFATFSGLRSLKENRPFTLWEGFLHGILIGVILWIKFTILGYYIGWVLFLGILYLREQGFKNGIKLLGSLLAGLAAVSLPVLLYFGLNRALKDLFEVYFYDNIFLYPHITEEGSAVRTLLMHYLHGVKLLLVHNNGSVLLLAVFCLLNRNNRKEKALLLCSAAVLFLTSFIGKWTWDFYTLAFMPLSVAGAGVLLSGWRSRTAFQKREATGEGKKSGFRINGVDVLRFAAIFMVLVFSILMTPNRVNMFTNLEEKDQYRYAQIMHEEKENPTLLQYGSLDAGFYQIAGILPNCKAFCSLASPIPEVSQLQKESVEQGLTDFIVGKGDFGPLYEKIASGSYNLYHRIQEPETSQ